MRQQEIWNVPLPPAFQRRWVGSCCRSSPRQLGDPHAENQGKPVAYITDQSAADRAWYVGTGQLEARSNRGLVHRTDHSRGRPIAVFIANHRYQCQDISDASFRSYVREPAGHLTVEDSRPTHEDPGEAHQIASALLADIKTLSAFFVIGGGVSARPEPKPTEPPPHEPKCKNVWTLPDRQGRGRPILLKKSDFESLPSYGETREKFDLPSRTPPTRVVVPLQPCCQFWQPPRPKVGYPA